MNGTAHQRQPGTHKIKRPERDDGDRSVHIVDIHIHCLEYGPQLIVALVRHLLYFIGLYICK